MMELTDGELLDQLAEAVGLDRYEGEHFEGGLFYCLADLIEPERETTEDVSESYGEFECKACGCRIDDVTAVDNGGINFCPDCGREIEDD